LIWMKNANGFPAKNWADALTAANGLASGSAGLTDGSQAGDWRLPNIRELQSLVDYGRKYPALPEGHPFTEVQYPYYWASTVNTDATAYAWWTHFGDGSAGGSLRGNSNYVWCVRGGP
jgi:hypothetical protein